MLSEPTYSFPESGCRSRGAPRGGELGRPHIADGARRDVHTVAVAVVAVTRVLALEGDRDADVLGAVAGAVVVDTGDDGAGDLQAVEAAVLGLDAQADVEGAALAPPFGDRARAFVRGVPRDDPHRGTAAAALVGTAEAGGGDAVVAVVLADGDVDALGVVVALAGDASFTVTFRPSEEATVTGSFGGSSSTRPPNSPTSPPAPPASPRRSASPGRAKP
ncbi:hypothetical protein ABIE67_007663 [Streptomyces sp. V4I8]|uniref:hypothetical protein n=1 Tax=Streptomyces sp. V4I8 TaxID=3156469 RepID=UPI003518A535